MSRSDVLLESVQSFFSESINADILIEILDKKKGVSLRYLEWFITNYSKKNDLSYRTKDGKNFSVHCCYKSTLDGYSKKLFDPFCRKNKIDFIIPGTDRQIKTTVAQLNFIKWCITNNVIEYVQGLKASSASRSSSPTPGVPTTPVQLHSSVC